MSTIVISYCTIESELSLLQVCSLLLDMPDAVDLNCGFFLCFFFFNCMNEDDYNLRYDTSRGDNGLSMWVYC